MVTITRSVPRSVLTSSTFPEKFANGPSTMRTESFFSKVIFGRGRSAEEAARKLTAAIFDGVQYANANPDATAALIAHYFRLSPEAVLAGMKSFKFYGRDNWRDHMKLHAGQMQFLAKWMFDNGKIPKLPDTQQWEKTSFIS